MKFRGVPATRTVGPDGGISRHALDAKRKGLVRLCTQRIWNRACEMTSSTISEIKSLLVSATNSPLWRRGPKSYQLRFQPPRITSSRVPISSINPSRFASGPSHTSPEATFAAADSLSPRRLLTSSTNTSSTCATRTGPRIRSTSTLAPWGSCSRSPPSVGQRQSSTSTFG